MHGCPNPGHCSGAAAAKPMHYSGAGATKVQNTFDPIYEDRDEEDAIAEAHRALDDLRDAEDELEYLEQWRSWNADMETAAAMQLRGSMGEFEQELADMPKKVGKFLKPRGCDGEVVQHLSPRSGGSDEEVVQYLSNDYVDQVVQSLRTAEKAIGIAVPADLPADYTARTQQEKIDTFKNQQFGRQFEAWQVEHMRAHSAIAGGTSFRTMSDPKIPDPGAPAGASQDLDF